MIELVFGVANRVVYTNWKGDTRQRTIKPLRVFYGATEYHPEPQWILVAWDPEKGEYRDFAMKDMVAMDWKD